MIYDVIVCRHFFREVFPICSESSYQLERGGVNVECWHQLLLALKFIHPMYGCLQFQQWHSNRCVLFLGGGWYDAQDIEFTGQTCCSHKLLLDCLWLVYVSFLHYLVTAAYKWDAETPGYVRKWWRCGDFRYFSCWLVMAVSAGKGLETNSFVFLLSFGFSNQSLFHPPCWAKSSKHRKKKTTPRSCYSFSLNNIIPPRRETGNYPVLSAAVCVGCAKHRLSTSVLELHSSEGVSERLARARNTHTQTALMEKNAPK